LPVPDAYLVDQSGDILATPYVVIEFMDGTTDLHPPNPVERAVQLAAVLSRIHAVDWSMLDVSFLVKEEAKIHRKLNRIPDKFDDSMHEQHVREVLSAVWPLPAINDPVILHGDFWPGNVLWKNGEISAVIDWENGEFGDPLADFANARLEILLLFGPEAMHDFAQTYLAHNLIDLTHLPYWELVAALRTASQITAWGFDAATEARIVETRRNFVEQALQKVTGSL
ncbi:MAG: phosphotransferase, partial [Chloroflexi bacterium]|nr:phosphotransferase [Chloroflexota bacterium]